MSNGSRGLPTIRERQKEEAKSASEEKTRRRKKFAGIAAVVVGLSILGVFVYGLISSSVAAGASRLPSVISADSDTVVIAPSSKQWWDRITNMAPLTFKINNLDPSKADLNITKLAYARNVDSKDREVPKTGPVRSVFIESPTADDAAKVQDWINASDGKESRSVLRNDNIVQVTYNWVHEFEVPEKNVSSRSDYSLDVSGSSAGMWINFTNQVDVLAGKDNPQRQIIDDYIKKSFALKPGTVWSGTSEDGVTWKGKYTSGGFDLSLFDPQAVQTELAGTQKLIAGKDNEGVNVKENNLYSFLINSGFKKTGTSENYGATPVPENSSPVNDEKLSAVILPSQWNNAAMGLGAKDEGVNTMIFSMADKEMNIVLRYGNNAIQIDMPSFTTKDAPNVTHVDIVPKS